MNRETEFWGYRRSDGRVGVRNHVAVISVMDNTNPVARRVAAAVSGTVPICASFGRGQRNEDQEQHDRTMIGLGANPNVAAALVISLEPKSAGHIAEGIAETGKPVEWFTVQGIGGTVKATERGIRIAAAMVVEAGKARRERASLSKLVLGVECGGSDTTSGLASNPATGQVSDWLVEAGGTVVLAETTELIGGEHYLVNRAASPQVAQALLKAVAWWEADARRRGFQLTNLVPDNIEGGLSTMEEKSLGAILKGGTSPLQEVVAYAQRPSKSGLVLMDTPGSGTESITGIAAGGAQVIIFSTGVGNPIGNPLAPTIKVSGNPNTVLHFADNIDVDVSGIITSGQPLEVASKQLYDGLISVANGKQTCSEVLGDVEISISVRR